MDDAARVFNVEAISDFKVALAMFVEDARSALTMIDVELRRGVDYITHDRPAYWQSEARRRADGVGRAKENLAHAKTFKAMDGYTPACTEEKKELEKANNRMRNAEQRLQATRHWCREITHEMNEFEGRLSQVTSLLDSEMPKAIAVLERIIKSLDKYLEVDTPNIPKAADNVTSMANPVSTQADKEDKKTTEDAAVEQPPAEEDQPQTRPSLSKPTTRI